MSYRFDRDELFSLTGWLARVSADLDDCLYGANQALARSHRGSNAVQALGPAAVECEARAEDLGRRALFLGSIHADGWSSAWDRQSELTALWQQIETFGGSDNDPRFDAMLRESADRERAWMTALKDLSPAQVASVAAALSA